MRHLITFHAFFNVAVAKGSKVLVTANFICLETAKFIHFRTLTYYKKFARSQKNSGKESRIFMINWIGYKAYLKSSHCNCLCDFASSFTIMMTATTTISLTTVWWITLLWFTGQKVLVLAPKGTFVHILFLRMFVCVCARVKKVYVFVETCKLNEYKLNKRWWVLLFSIFFPIIKWTPNKVLVQREHHICSHLSFLMLFTSFGAKHLTVYKMAKLFPEHRQHFGNFRIITEFIC